MKKEQRAVYLELAKLEVQPKGWEESSQMALCFFCKYAHWVGSCQEADLECLHKLEQIAGDSWNIWAGCQDCWGFAPAWRLDDTVDMAGMLLNGIWADIKTMRLPARGRPRGSQTRNHHGRQQELI